MSQSTTSGRKRARLREPLGPVVGDRDVVPAELERLAQAVGRVDVVLDDEHAAGCGPRRRGASVGGGSARGGLERQADRERRRPCRGPSLARADRAAVHLHQPLDEGEPEAEPALAAVEGRVRLREGLEQAGQHLRRDPHAGVAHREDRAAARAASASTETVVVPPRAE